MKNNINLVVKVNSDNFENTLMTLEAYKELRLQMSTGDFHTHEHILLEGDLNKESVLTIKDFLD